MLRNLLIPSRLLTHRRRSRIVLFTALPTAWSHAKIAVDNHQYSTDQVKLSRIRSLESENPLPHRCIGHRRVAVSVEVVRL